MFIPFGDGENLMEEIRTWKTCDFFTIEQRSEHDTKPISYAQVSALQRALKRRIVFSEYEKLWIDGRNTMEFRLYEKPIYLDKNVLA